MERMEAISCRHSVRSYTDRPLEGAVLAALEAEIAACSAEGGLGLRLVREDPKAFGGLMAHYGKFRGVRNYLLLAGPPGPDLEEKLGYYGQRIALEATRLGLDSCWVALTFRKGRCRRLVEPEHKLVCVLTLGYGTDHGVPHKSKTLEAVTRVSGEMPAWFRAGAEAALLAPTAVNQQKFLLTLEGDGVRAEALPGPYSKVDLGIVKYHFEIGAGRENFVWR